MITLFLIMSFTTNSLLKAEFYLLISPLLNEFTTNLQLLFLLNPKQLSVTENMKASMCVRWRVVSLFFRYEMSTYQAWKKHYVGFM